MAKLTKSQKELILLGLVLATIVIVLSVYIFKPAPPAEEEVYAPKTVDTRIPKDLLEQPEYHRLRLPVELPIVPGRMGRDNPFAPY